MIIKKKRMENVYEYKTIFFSIINVINLRVRVRITNGKHGSMN